MTRSELEHLICAAGTIADDRQLIVIASQAILTQGMTDRDTLRAIAPHQAQAGAARAGERANRCRFLIGLPATMNRTDRSVPGGGDSVSVRTPQRVSEAEAPAPVRP
jgi:hypothetical protein